MFDQRDVRAPGHDGHAEREHGDHDRGREVMTPLTHRQRRKDGKGHAREKAAQAQRIGRQRGQRARDDAGEHDEDERGSLERHDRQHQRAADAPRDRQQGHSDPHAGANRKVGLPTAAGNE